MNDTTPTEKPATQPAGFKVLSERLAGHPQGSRVTAADLAGANVDALIAGGHITADQTLTKEKK